MKPTDGFDDGVSPTDSEYLHNEEVAHEHGDINIRAVIGFLFGLMVLTAVVMALMAGVFVGLDRMAAASDPQLSPVAVPAGQPPPEPRLLTNEPQQLQKTRDMEAEALRGGRDEATGTARLSIDEAKKQVVMKGLPVRAGEAIDSRLGTRAPASGESSGGRVLGNRSPVAPPAAAGQQPGAAGQTRPKGH